MTDMVNNPTPMSADDFMRCVDINPETGCWEWNKSRSEKRGGYGQKRLGGKTYKSHRLSWMIFRSHIPEGLFVCHKCDNPPCCNPDHLFLGTGRDNVRDAIEKGRAFIPTTEPGELSPSAKLSAVDVLKIREMHKSGVSLAELGRMFNVTKQAIWRIKEGLSWKTT